MRQPARFLGVRGRHMIDIHLKKIRRRDDVSAEEEQVIRGLVSHTISVPADRVVIRAGELLNQSMLLLDGWAARAKDLPSGQRQFAEIHLPGDFADLHSFTLKRLDHDVISISPCQFAIVPHERLKAMTERMPHLTRVYWFSTNLDAAIHREWALSLGRRSAISRMAHLFCELFIRLEIVGLTRDRSYDFPLTQAELGESLGLTSVHVNRTLQELRRMGLIDVEDRRVTIHDLGALKGVAEFDPSYLYLEKMPR
jgi:CRP-like cAMP-binding protein